MRNYVKYLVRVKNRSGLSLFLEIVQNRDSLVFGNVGVLRPTFLAASLAVNLSFFGHLLGSNIGRSTRNSLRPKYTSAFRKEFWLSNQNT